MSKLVFLQPADALSAFTQHQADAWAIWDPYTAQAEGAAAGAQHRPGQGRDQRLLVRRRVGSGAGGPEAEHRATATCWCASKRRCAGRRTTANSGRTATPPRWASTRSRRGRAGSKPAAADRAGRRDRRIRAGAGRPVRGIGPDRSPAPEFDNWVDRRYSDVLAPLFVSTNLRKAACLLSPNRRLRRRSSSGSCPPTVTADRSSAHRTRRLTTPCPPTTARRAVGISPRWPAPPTGWDTKGC